MAVADDFTIDYVNKKVTHTSGTTVYTVNALYTYLMDTLDELAQMDDTIPMSAQTPNAYTLINAWFMSDITCKFLKEGAITTSGQLNEIQVIKLDGITFDPVAGDIGKAVTDDTVEIGNLLDYEIDSYGVDTGKWWVRTGSGTAIADNSAMAITSGTGAGVASAASEDGENLWSNVYTLGTIQTDDSETIYLIQNASKLTNGGWYSSGHIDILVKVKETGSFINSGIITVFLRHYPGTLPARGNADLYDHFEINLSAGGRNAVPLATSPDLNNVTDDETVATYNDIDIAFVNGTVTHGSVTGTFVAYDSISWTGGTGVSIKDVSGTMTIGNVDGDNGPLNTEVISGTGWSCTATADMTVARTTTKNFEQGSSYNYSICVNVSTRTVAQMYEYFKYVTRETATFSTYPVKMVSTALAIDKKNGEQYETTFRDYDTPANSFSAVKASPLGTFAGGTFFGARGVWIENMASADIQAYQLVDADNTTRTPPIYASVAISNLLSSDRVSVFRTTSGTTIKKDMYTATAGNTAGNTDFVVTETITSDTPSAGVIRVVDTSDTGPTRETRYSYASWSTSTFSTIKQLPNETNGLDRTYTQTDDTAYVPFIDTTATTDTASVSVIFYTSRTILVRVRRYTATAILPFETTGTFASTGYSTSAIRTADAIVG